MYTIENQDERVKCSTILEGLAENRVLSIDIDEDKDTFTLLEECDSYFCVTLTREQFLAFIEELKKLTI